MKTQADTLATAISMCARARRCGIDSDSCIVHARPGTLKFSRQSYASAVDVEIPAAGDDEFEAIVSMKNLGSLVPAFKSRGRADAYISIDGERVILSTGTYAVELFQYAYIDEPKNEPDFGITLEIATLCGDDLKSILGFLASAFDESPYEFARCLQVIRCGRTIDLVVLNQRRLAYVSLLLNDVQSREEVLVDEGALRYLSELSGLKNVCIGMSDDDGTVVQASWGEDCLVSIRPAYHDGISLPDYERFILMRGACVEVSRRELKRACENVMTFKSSHKILPVTMRIAGGQAWFTYNDEDEVSFRTTIHARVTEHDVRFMLNAIELYNFIRHFPEAENDYVRLWYADDESPVLIMPSEAKCDMRGVVMPFKIDDGVNDEAQ